MNEDLYSEIDNIVEICSAHGFFSTHQQTALLTNKACFVAKGLGIVNQRPSNSYELGTKGSDILLSGLTTKEDLKKESQKEDLKFTQLKYWYLIILVPIILSGVISYLVTFLTKGG